MIYAIIDKKTNRVIGCDIATPEMLISKNHPENTFYVPVQSINNPVQVGYFWNEKTNKFSEQEITYE